MTHSHRHPKSKLQYFRMDVLAYLVPVVGKTTRRFPLQATDRNVAAIARAQWIAHYKAKIVRLKKDAVSSGWSWRRSCAQLRLPQDWLQQALLARWESSREEPEKNRAVPASGRAKQKGRKDERSSKHGHSSFQIEPRASGEPEPRLLARTGRAGRTCLQLGATRGSHSRCFTTRACGRGRHIKGWDRRRGGDRCGSGDCFHC